MSPLSTLTDLSLNNLRLYTDGGYHVNKPPTPVSWAFAVVDPTSNTLLHQANGVMRDDGSRQIAGELFAVMAGTEYIFNKYPNSTVDVYSDYLGVKCWAEGSWRANKDVSQQYVNYIINHIDKLKFHHVRGHSGDYWNEYVDRLMS